MKKTLSIILFVMSLFLVNAQKLEESSVLEKSNLRPIESVADEQGGKVDKETKVLRINRKEYFKPEAEEAEAIALSYLQAKQDVYGLSSNLNDLKIIKIVESPAGKYVYCQQYIHDIPVFATNFVIFLNKENVITYTLNEFRNVAKYETINGNPSITDNEALKVVSEYLNATGKIIGEPQTELVYFESGDRGLELAWKINILSMEPMGSWQIFINADDKRIIHIEDVRTSASGSGRVFRPNPLVSANASYGGNYVHSNGATNSYLDGQLMQVPLNDLTFENGVYKLKGPYCVVEDIDAPFGHIIPELPTPNFNYKRDQEQFAAVMCYYHVDLAARRILQLGYEIPVGLKNFRIDPHGAYRQRNAWYDPSNNYVSLGSSYGSVNNTFVPAAEDADVIWHEYAHGIQWKFTPSGMPNSGETQSVKEGSSDYWATSYKRSLYPNYWAALCVWFDMDDPIVARRADLNWVYPTDYVLGHNGGQIWSSALMKIWGDLGRDVTDKLFLETHLIWGQSPSMRDAAAAFIQADVNLYGGIHLCDITTRFNEHGLVAPITITQNTIWNTPVYAASTITIPAGGTLTVTSEIKFSANSGIVVQPGGKLVIDGGTLTAACPGKLWRGITVLGNSGLSQTEQNQGVVELSGALIEHAVCAIAAHIGGFNIPVDSLSGGIIKAVNSTFKNNLQAIAYAPYENKNSVGVIMDNVGKFTKCTFTVDNNHRFPTSGVFFESHIRMWGVRGITFIGCSFDNTITTGSNQGGAGIYTLDAGFKVINYCDPSGAIQGIDCACLAQYNTPATFSNQTYGIFSSSTGTPRTIYIDQAEFHSIVSSSVRLSDQNNYRLTRCTFTDIKYRALYSAYSSGYRIEENNFSALPSNVSGIEMYASGIAENRIYKNNFTSLRRGISVGGNNGRVGRGGGGDPGTGISPSGLQFICNLFTNNDYDIYVWTNATVRHHQGSLLAGADNRFIGTQTSSFYFAGSQAITYYRRPPGQIRPDPYEPYNPTSNVTINRTATANPCTTTFCTPVGGGGHRSDLSDIEQYIAMQSQYDQLLANLGENPEILQQLLVLSDAMRELSDNAISGILHDSVIYVDALKSWYEVVRTPIAKYWLAEVYASESNYEQSEAILRAIPPAFDFSEPELIEHDNYMQFHHFKKQMLLSGRNWTLLDESEIAQLQRIAEATKGRSSGMAKGALCFFFDICYEDEFEAEGQGEEEKEEGKEGEGEKSPSFGGTEGRLYELSIYPNPTPSEMMVSLNNPAVKIVRMEVYDMTSRKVHQQIVNQSFDTLRLNELERGVYILKVYLDQGDMLVRKVVKQ